MSEKAQNEEKKDEKAILPEEKQSVTQHSVTVNGKTLNYTVTAGTMLLKEEDVEEGEKAKASVFYVAYTLDQEAGAAQRPVTFSFNGGPGSSSVWMHLGLLGPKRVLMKDDGSPLPPPYKMVDNEYTLLTESDLVFIDPVSTGYSRAVPKEKPEQFHNYQKDIESVGEFIRLWTTRNNRWGAAKFLIGESYGTTRAGGLAEHLHQRYGMYLNGIMLVSSIMNFMTARFTPGNDLPYLLFLPTYTATAWYHNRLGADLQADLRKTLDEVEDFVMNEYTLALMKGNKLTGEDRKGIVKKLARYTGLSEAYIERTNLRIEIFRFTKELMRETGETVGRLDTRYKGFDRDSAGEMFEYDPAYSAIQGVYTATLYDYLRSDLKFEIDQHYEILNSLYQTWQYDTYQNQFVNTAERLRKAFQSNPDLKIIVCNGYYDLATPYFATDYTFSHIELPEELQKNIKMTFYESGHMMYVHLPSLEQAGKDLAQFVQESK